jgi:hypothetical protein
MDDADEGSRRGLVGRGRNSSRSTGNGSLASGTSGVIGRRDSLSLSLGFPLLEENIKVAVAVVTGSVIRIGDMERGKSGIRGAGGNQGNRCYRLYGRPPINIVWQRLEESTFATKVGAFEDDRQYSF